MLHFQTVNRVYYSTPYFTSNEPLRDIAPIMPLSFSACTSYMRMQVDCN